MKLLVPILMSAAIHVAAVIFMPKPMVIQSNKLINLPDVQFQISLASDPTILNNQPLPNLLVQSKFVAKKLNKSTVDENGKDKYDVHNPESVPQKNGNTKKYLPTTELDIKALPISNLDIAMFRETFISGLPVKLRLYINASGHVDKIERLSVQEQDDAFATRLEDLLSNLTFLPAKKDGIAVNSYQEMQLGFN